MNIGCNSSARQDFVQSAIQSVRLLLGFGILSFAISAHAQGTTWKDQVVFSDGMLSVNVSDVLVAELLNEIGLKAKVRILVDSSLAQRKITVTYKGLTVERGIERIVRELGLPDLAMSYRPAKGPNGTDAWVVDFARLMAKSTPTAPGLVVKDINDLIRFINKVGAHDADCEQAYFALSSLDLASKRWWQTAGRLPQLLETAKNPKLATCVRMASLELYISKLSKDELQKISPDLQSYFGEASVPDKLVARLTQILAERDVAPTQLIETILESDARGQAARSHAWYAAGRTQTYTPHLLDLAMKDANSAGTTQSVSGKMALEYMSKLPPASVAAEDESKVNVSVVQAINRAIELPNDSGLNELGRSMAAVSAIPRFLPKAEVVPYLGLVVVKAANDNVKLSALDTLLTIRSEYATEVAAQTATISANLDALFTNVVSRERAKVRLNKLNNQ